MQNDSSWTRANATNFACDKNVIVYGRGVTSPKRRGKVCDTDRNSRNDILTWSTAIKFIQKYLKIYMHVTYVDENTLFETN